MRSGRRNVLVVEDNHDLRRAMCELFEANGYAVCEAPDGRTAREHLNRSTPDLVCIDLVLPESSGYELCEEIRSSERHASVPVLVISGRSDASGRAHAIEAGANGFVAKPFDSSELIRRVAALLDRPAAAEAL